MFFKKAARVLLLTFGFFYSTIIITAFSVVASCMRFLGYTLYYTFQAFLLLMTNDETRIFCLATLLGIFVASGFSVPLAVHLLQSFLVPALSVLLTALPFMAAGLLSVAGAYVLYRLSFDLWAGLPYCLLDFSNWLERGDALSKAFTSPFTYLNARMALWFGDHCDMYNYLNRDKEEKTAVIKESIATIITTNKTTTTLLKVYFAEPIASIITQYAMPLMILPIITPLFSLREQVLTEAYEVYLPRTTTWRSRGEIQRQSITQMDVESVLKNLTKDERKALENSPFFTDAKGEEKKPSFAEKEEEKISELLPPSSLLQYIQSPEKNEDYLSYQQDLRKQAARSLTS